MTDPAMTYEDFLRAKVAIASDAGVTIDPSRIHPMAKPHQRDIIAWAARRGRAAIFASFGTGKTLMQIELTRLLLEHEGGEARGLIVIPLGVRQEFARDAATLGVPVRFIRRAEEVDGPGIYTTNYESVRDGRLDVSGFVSVSLDESAILRGFGGSKTFRELMCAFEGTKYRFVATATPSPNEYIEILSYAAFLGVMDVSAGKTRFFKRDSTNADKLTIHPHKEFEFWLWVASWAVFLTTPSDLGHDDAGYVLPLIEVHWHEVPSDHAGAGADRDGQQRMFRNAAIGVSEQAAEKRSSMDARLDKLMELRALDPSAHRILWHDLEDERRAIERAVPDVRSVYGSLDLEERERRIIDFSDGGFRELAAKPSVAGAGCNFQRHCAWAIYLGIGFRFHEFIQSLHRIQRFGQTRPVRIDLIYTEAERDVRRLLEAKWARHVEMTTNMRALVREYGLNKLAMASALHRTMGVARQEASGEGWRVIHNDAVLETRAMDADSVDLIVTSVPFSTQYEYTPSFNDFGHTDDNAHFWAQMDYLTPELLRILKPGRNICVHVKDRIAPGGLTGHGFQTLQPFHAEAIFHYIRHGFALLGVKTVTTDVVRENNQTYRLGWSEQCKDGTRMGCGVPEYVLILRKPPTDASKGYADVPVVKEKPWCDDGSWRADAGRDGSEDWREDDDECDAPIVQVPPPRADGRGAPFNKKNNWRHPIPGTGYSRAMWQLDAHGYLRSSGDRLLTSEDLRTMPHEMMFKWWETRDMEHVYDFAEHVKVCEELDYVERLPATFMLFPPHSNHPDVWTDITRMRTLNAEQSQNGREMHLCALQLDIVDRLIVQHSMEGETVFDPFAGIGTVPVRAMKLKRRGLGTELSPTYWRDAVGYCRAEEARAAVPTLFDFLDMEEAA